MKCHCVHFYIVVWMAMNGSLIKINKREWYASRHDHWKARVKAGSEMLLSWFIQWIILFTYFYLYYAKLCEWTFFLFLSLFFCSFLFVVVAMKFIYILQKI